LMRKSFHKLFKLYSVNKELPMVDIMETSVALYMKLMSLKEVRGQIRRGKNLEDIVTEAFRPKE